MTAKSGIPLNRYNRRRNKQLEEKGLVLDGASPNHLMFVVDFATWRYENRGQMGATPEHLRYRRRKLFFKSHAGGGASDV